MARRLIGLDIGTNAVTVAEVRPGEPPRLVMFGQVALGRETMREGEVADDAAVTEAVGRLRAEVGLKHAAVRLGLASPRVVVRQIEMPLMSREELSSALQVPSGRAHSDSARRRRARLRDPRAGEPGRERRAADARVARRRAGSDGAAARRRRRSRRSPSRRRRSRAARADPSARAVRARARVGRRRRGGSRRRGAKADSGPRLSVRTASASVPKESCRSAAVSRRSRCTKSVSRGSCVCSVPAVAS